MAKSRQISVTGVATSDPFPLNYHNEHYKCSLIGAANGLVDWTVEVTGDDVYASDFNPATATWQDHSYLASLTSSDKGNLEFPATAIRLKNNAAGTITLTVIEPYL